MTDLDKPERRLSRWHEAVLSALVVLIAAYALLWYFRCEVGLIRPMANMRFFYYGTEPGSFSDRALYWIYAPVYKPHLYWQELWYGERLEVHWTDRRDYYGPDEP